jgi:hypothetical protein
VCRQTDVRGDVGERAEGRVVLGAPARPFPSSILLDKTRRDIGKSQSIWTDSKMETAGSHLVRHRLGEGADERPAVEVEADAVAAQVQVTCAGGMTYMGG